MKLSPEIFNILNQEYIKSIYHETDYKTCKGYIVLAVDGSTIELPNTKEVKEIYGGCQIQ